MRPSHTVYEKWLTSTRKVLGALGSFWMIPMAQGLEFVLGAYMPLVDGVLDDGYDPVFQYIVVSLAIGHGALQSLPARKNALLDVDNCARNCQYIIQTIAGFSAQISSKCYGAFLCVFATQDAVASMHPLAGLREFADIHRNYQCEGHTVNASAAWKKNFAAIQKQLKPQTRLI
eukprot:251657-Rhodomonas_salina.1